MIIHSFNGGGIRGLIIAFIMRMAESMNPGKEIKADIIAGTSVGSIIATLRALGYSWLDICKFFVELGPVIFKKRCIPRILRAKYSDHNFNSILKKYIGENTMISDVSGYVLVIPTTDTTNDSLKVWTNRGCYTVSPEGEGVYIKDSSQDAKLWEIVRASSSAPRYFVRFRIGKRVYEDGGLKANNPSPIAYSIARALTEAPINILSITTGRKNHVLKESQYDDGLQVAPHVIDSALDAIDRNAHFTVKSLLRAKDTYYRIEPVLKYSSGLVDDASKENIDNMIKDASESYSLNASALSKFFEQINPLK